MWQYLTCNWRDSRVVLPHDQAHLLCTTEMNKMQLPPVVHRTFIPLNMRNGIAECGKRRWNSTSDSFRYRACEI